MIISDWTFTLRIYSIKIICMHYIWIYINWIVIQQFVNFGLMCTVPWEKKIGDRLLSTHSWNHVWLNILLFKCRLIYKYAKLSITFMLTNDLRSIHTIAMKFAGVLLFNITIWKMYAFMYPSWMNHEKQTVRRHGILGFLEFWMTQNWDCYANMMLYENENDFIYFSFHPTCVSTLYWSVWFAGFGKLCSLCNRGEKFGFCAGMGKAK